MTADQGAGGGIGTNWAGNHTYRAARAGPPRLRRGGP